jgi:hypothetical protein
MLILWGVLAAAAVAFAVWLAMRDRDILPIAACAGALVCGLNEPIFDVLAKLVYAHSPYLAYTAFGRQIPWTVVLGYVPWVGLVPYLLFRMMASGVSRSRLHLIAGGLLASVAGVEFLNVVWLHAWKYYGQSPWRGVLGGGIVQMAAMPMLCALLYYLFAGGLPAWRRAVLGVVFPAVTLPMVFAGTSWPLYFVNHASVSGAVAWAAAAVTVVFSLAAVGAITRNARRWYDGELALSLGAAVIPREEKASVG